jgi:hypothetical protein
MLFFGTGDREHPKELTAVNLLYTLKDRHYSGILTESDLVDVTLGPLQDPGDPCSILEGTVRMYALKAKSGNAAFDLDLLNDRGGTVISRSGRSTTIGSAIPSGTIIVLTQGEATAHVGVGGGVYTPPLPPRSSLIPVYWRFKH